MAAGIVGLLFLQVLERVTEERDTLQLSLAELGNELWYALRKERQLLGTVERHTSSEGGGGRGIWVAGDCGGWGGRSCADFGFIGFKGFFALGWEHAFPGATEGEREKGKETLRDYEAQAVSLTVSFQKGITKLPTTSKCFLFA